MYNKEFPHGITFNNNFIIITNITKKHQGFYWCDGSDIERGYFIGGGELIIS